MTPPAAPARRLVLVPMSSSGRESAAPRSNLRRYQLARLTLDGRRSGSSDKLAHLREMHD